MTKNIKLNNGNDKNILKIIFVVIISILLCFFISYKNSNDNLYLNINIEQIFGSDINLKNETCLFIKNKLLERKRPFNYEDEFYFFISLISCQIPFSFIRFADGEEYIMRGHTIKSIDKWHWEPKNQKFRKSLIESSSICTNPNNFIGIPCKNWSKFSKSILSFSKCRSAKYMSYSTLFTNKNHLQFKNWILRFISSSKRWKIILVANSNINKNISWAYKFFPVPNNVVGIWDQFSAPFLEKLSVEAKQNNLLFFVSAGPATNIIIDYLTKINKKNIYIDFGSSIEFITKGYSSRSYSDDNSKLSLKKCESFFLQGKEIIYIS